MYQLMEDYPSPAEGNGLENRQACKSAQGFESLILLIGILAEWLKASRKENDFSERMETNRRV